MEITASQREEKIKDNFSKFVTTSAYKQMEESEAAEEKNV